MTKKREKPAGSGRKAGTRNKERDDVLIIPAQCRTCDSTDFEVQRIVGSQAYEQEVAGRWYSHTTLRDVRCKSCGQYARHRLLECKPHEE